jgi:hypothetical protein
MEPKSSRAEMKPFSRLAAPWLQRPRKFAPVLRGENHALDDIRNLAHPVALGAGHFLYHGRLYSHPIAFGRRCSCD